MGNVSNNISIGYLYVYANAVWEKVAYECVMPLSVRRREGEKKCIKASLYLSVINQL